MNPAIELTEKYVRNGWPALPRPDLKPPKGWSRSFLTAVNRVRNHQLSPDGEKIAFIWDRDGYSDVYLMPAQGGWPARLTTGRGPEVYWDDEIPQWSPDGRWLAFGMNDHVHIVPSTGGLPVKITDFTEGAFAPIWMPDSNGLLVRTERGEHTRLLLTDRAGSWPRPLVELPGDVTDARPSPDGTLVAFCFQPEPDRNRLDLRLIDLSSGEIRLLTGAPRQKDWSPRWSPDGRLLAFLSQRSDFNEVWLIRPDGQDLRHLCQAGADIADITWSPDSRRIACTVNRGGAFELGVIDVETGTVSSFRTGKGYHSRPQWSPDGKWLTVEYEDPVQPPDLYRVGFPGGNLERLTWSNLPALATLDLVIPEPISYKSFDGLEIPAFLYRPREANRAAVVYPHGGPSSQHALEWDLFIQYLVAKGYTILAPNYRGSTGYGVTFEQANYLAWGREDMQDCLSGAALLPQLADVDPSRIAIYGASYGGYLVACCLSRDPDFRFRCGVSKFGDANLVTSWAQCNRELRKYTEMMLGHPARNPEIYREGSPIHQVENIRSPVLILHGLLDDIVPPEASEEWVEALQRADKAFEYKTYADEPHGFLKQHSQADAYSRIERFLDWHLMPPGIGESEPSEGGGRSQ